MPSDVRIAIAETDAEREAVYRFRYDVYVEEMGRYRSAADHARRTFREAEDEQSVIFYAACGDEVVDTNRLTWGGAGPLPRRMIEQFGLVPFLAEVPVERIAVGERGMIAPQPRGSDLLLDMVRFSQRTFVPLREPQRLIRRVLTTVGVCGDYLLRRPARPWPPVVIVLQPGRSHRGLFLVRSGFSRALSTVRAKVRPTRGTGSISDSVSPARDPNGTYGAHGCVVGPACAGVT